MDICWSCHKSLEEDAIFCRFCSSIQPVRHNNLFTLFDLPEQFEIDKNVLESKYLSLQKQLHPDRFTHKNITEQMHALSWSSFLNDGYNILTDKVQLSCKLIELKGITDVLNRKPSMHIMQEQFELREALEETDNLETLQQEVAEKIKLCYKAIQKAFNAKNLEEAAEKTLELRFLTKFEKDIKRKKRRIKN